ncbi:MAG: 3-oxoacyl-ACP reductase [Bacteroidia bacterium]|nr:MAG: 3-oxoacyl-ACP reductase [Bacteroidia bacterium]
MSQKLIIITGASKGIGLAIARRLLLDNFKVINLDVSSPEKQDTDIEFIKCDVSLESDVLQSFQFIQSKYPEIYGVINNAGIIRDNVIWKMSVEDFEKVINVNLKGTWLVCREAVKIMKQQSFGKIINIASRALLGNPGQTNYSASKAGIVGLSRALALEVGKYNISVNVIAPGLIKTELTDNLPPHVLQKLIDAQPQKNIGKPEDIAEVASFLLNEKTNFINGQVIYVDGGKSIGHVTL